MVVSRYRLLLQQRHVVQLGRGRRHLPDFIAEESKKIGVVVGRQSETRTEELDGSAVVVEVVEGERAEVGHVARFQPLHSGKRLHLVERILPGFISEY